MGARLFCLVRTNDLTGGPSRMSSTKGYFSQLNMGVGKNFPPSSVTSKSIFYGKAGIGTGRISQTTGQYPGPLADHIFA